MNIEDKTELRKMIHQEMFKQSVFYYAGQLSSCKTNAALQNRVNFFGCLKPRGIPQIRPEQNQSS